MNFKLSICNDLMSLIIYTNNLFTGVVFVLLVVVILAYKKWKRKPEEQTN